MEESVHGGPQRQEYAGGGSIQLGEVHLCRGFFTVLAGDCRGNSKPAGKYKKGIIPIRKTRSLPAVYFVLFAKHPLVSFV